MKLTVASLCLTFVLFFAGDVSAQCVKCRATKSIGYVAVSRDVFYAVSKKSQTFGKALALFYENGRLGFEQAKVFTFEGRKEVEMVVEAVCVNESPVAIKFIRSDNRQSLELAIVQEPDFSETDKDRWTVSSWIIK